MAGPGTELGVRAAGWMPTSQLVGKWNLGFPSPLCGIKGQVGIGDTARAAGNEMDHDEVRSADVS